jgi:hypothetical protein
VTVQFTLYILFDGRALEIGPGDHETVRLECYTALHSLDFSFQL